MDFSKWKLRLRISFGIAVLLGLVPTGFVLYHWGLSMAETKSGASLLQYAWMITLLMGFAVSVWLVKGCQDIKEGYWMYYFSIIISVIACSNLGEMEVVFGKFLVWLVLLGSLIYHLLVYIEEGPSDRLSITIEEFGRRYVLSATVLMTPAMAYGIASLIPTLVGLTMAFSAVIAVTLIVVAVWRGYRAQEAVALLVAAFIFELVAVAFLVHFAFSLCIVGFALFLQVFYEKKEKIETEDVTE